MSPTIFRGMRRDGRLPVAVPATAAAYLQERRDRLGRRLAEVADQAEREALSKVRICGAELKITPLDAVTPEAAEAFARRLYGMLPSLRIGVPEDGAGAGPGPAVVRVAPVVRGDRTAPRLRLRPLEQQPPLAVLPIRQLRGMGLQALQERPGAYAPHRTVPRAGPWYRSTVSSAF